MMIINSQVHAYEANTPKRPWHSVPNWPDHVTGDEMVAAMDKVGVDGAIKEVYKQHYHINLKALKLLENLLRLHAPVICRCFCSIAVL